LPKEKELNFFGNPWVPNNLVGHSITLGSFTFEYMKRFNVSHPNDETVHVYGEASPDYLVSPYQVIDIQNVDKKELCDQVPLSIRYCRISFGMPHR